MTTNRDSTQGPKGPPPRGAEPEGSVRTCVACRQKGERDDLVRWVAAEDGRVALDPRATRAGRGAWVHPTRACLAAMVKRHAAERALKVDAQRDLDAQALLAQLRAALVQKVTSLLVVSSRTRTLAIGAEAVAAMLEKGRARCVLVAKDAGDHTLRALTDAPGRGGPRVLRYGDKATLGALFDRGEIALVALLDFRIANEAASTIERLAALEET